MSPCVIDPSSGMFRSVAPRQSQMVATTTADMPAGAGAFEHELLQAALPTAAPALPTVPDLFGAAPTQPYFAMLRRVRLEVPVGADVDEEPPRQRARLENASMSEGSAHRLLTSHRFSRLIEERCSYFHFGPDFTIPAEPKASGGTRMNARSTVRFVDALSDVHTRFTRVVGDETVRERRVSSGGVQPTSATSVVSGPRDGVTDSGRWDATFCGYFLVCRHHPQWRTWQAMFFVEDGAPQVLLVAESAPFRRHLTSVCAEVGVVIDWRDGAALAYSSPDETKMLPDAAASTSQGGKDRAPTLSPVACVTAVFDALLNLPDVAGAVVAEGDAASHVAANGAARLAERCTILAPFPFRYGEWRAVTPRRLQQGAAAPATAKRSVAWAIGDTTGSASDGTLVLPHAVLALVRLLTDELMLPYVSLSFSPAEFGKDVARDPRSHAAAASRGTGLGRTVGGRPQDVAAAGPGSSALVLLGPSRLSDSWLTLDAATAKLDEAVFCPLRIDGRLTSVPKSGEVVGVPTPRYQWYCRNMVYKAATDDPSGADDPEVI